MAFEITIPRLGWSMEEGTFVRWLKNDGDVVKSGDAVFELEGEKAAQDIEAVDSGILRIPATAPAPGTVVAVGTVIGYLVAEGEATPAHTVAAAAMPKAAKNDATPAVPVTQPQPKVADPVIAPAAPPSVRRLAREMGVNLSSLGGSGPAGRITIDDVRTTKASTSASKVTAQSSVASPRARRVAKELGIDWRRVVGSGRDGRVRESDVRTAATNSGSGSFASTMEIGSRRRTIANRMKASRDRVVPVTLTTRVDASNLVGLRNQFKQAQIDSPIPSYSDIILKLVSLALVQHPTLAIREEGDQWIMPSTAEGIHVGFAVDTPDGLVVPVVQSAGSLGLFEIAKTSATLIEKARLGKLSVSQMQGGVFTITNLGGFGIEAFTPVINLPETAILGLGRISREPVVVDEKVVIRDQMTLSLTFDHRIVDGAPAARFLQTVGQAIENPSAWLLREIG